jgi:hypothetical protein
MYVYQTVAPVCLWGLLVNQNISVDPIYLSCTDYYKILYRQPQKKKENV